MRNIYCYIRGLEMDSNPTSRYKLPDEEPSLETSKSSAYIFQVVVYWGFGGAVVRAFHL